MKRSSLFMTAMLAMAMTSGIPMEQREYVTTPPQSPEAAQQKLAAAQAKRDRKKAKRAAPTAQEPK